MLLTELILSKRGPLAKVWLSAHHERKLSKQQALGVDVEESVDAILTQDQGPITLRMSGQLMLGVTRIYSRKVQYLLDDCKETRERITLAFRPGVVDLAQDQIRASAQAITFSSGTDNLDLIDWTWAAPTDYAPRGLHTAPPAKTLRPAGREFGAYNFGRPPAGSIYGGSTASRQSSQDDTSHLDSQDFSGIDLDLRLEDFDRSSVEFARRAATPLSLTGRSARSGSAREKSFGGLGAMDGDVSFEPMDLGLDFDLPLDLQPQNVQLADGDDRSRRQSSALSTPPPSSPPPTLFLAKPAEAKSKRPRLAQADDDIELPDAVFAPNRDISALLIPERYIPSDPQMIYLESIISDPGAHFLPSVRVGDETKIYAGPYGLSSELADLFSFPSNILRRDTSDQVDDVNEEDPERTPKRARMGTEAESSVPDVEVARRASAVPSEFGFPTPGGDFDMSFGPNEPFEMGMDEGPLFETPKKIPQQSRIRSPSLAPSRAESIARQIQFADDGSHPLAMFDPRMGEVEPESQSLLGETPSKSSVVESRGAYSKNTGMAMGLLRRELGSVEADKKVTFGTVADKASRRAAAAFFFELLVLGTRDCVSLEQDKSYQDIEIRSKEKLFAEMTA
ncbi:hypothetical protein M231_00604 [Tremella mesenterica]|uniref:Cohesin complex subunit SCC1 n=1 Tax=Tremella mesenterica TaxID=5217 RepID=A0A4Q1BVT3_TREME|nr:hypothetical protein M231_00604 [Tremella mesenterica]